ncbi:MAG: DUF4202 family protein, partial [Candidatus Micrarchaeota archaeon]
MDDDVEQPLSLRAVTTLIASDTFIRGVDIMKTELYEKTREFVADSFEKAGKSSQMIHFDRAVHWVKTLRPEADEALCIAAVAHDIERAFRQPDMHERKAASYTNPDFFRTHEERGAGIIAEFLEKQGAEKSIVERVSKLVARHEEGGDEDQNLLRDADSLSFLENNVQRFLERLG